MIRKLAFCFGAIIVLSIPGTSRAAPAQPVLYGPANIGNFYVGVSGGVIIPEKLHGTFSGAIVGSGDLSFKTGAVGTGFLGYHLNNYFAVEGQGGFASFDEDNFSGTLNGVSGSASINGRVHTIIGLGNVIVTPFGRSGFAPYFGAGAGYASFDEKVNSIGGIAVNTSNTDSGVAADGILGFDAVVGSRWSIGARYQFLWVNIANTSTSSGVTTKQDNFTAHVITLTAAFHF
jgi:outer membrane protein W